MAKKAKGGKKKAGKEHRAWGDRRGTVPHARKQSDRRPPDPPLNTKIRKRGE